MFDKLRSIGLIVCLVALGCDRGRQEPEPQYGMGPREAGVRQFRMAVHPLHNPGRLVQAYQPLIDHVNAGLKDSRLVLEASRDYSLFEEKYRNRKPEFLLPNPWQTLQAMKVGYKVIASAGEPEDFKGLFIVRKDNPISTPLDLKGKVVSYPASTALAACVMPQYFLHRHGLNVNRDIENHYVGSQESAIMNAYLKLSAVGVTWPPPWRAFQKDHPAEASELKVLWATESLINNSVMVRDDVPRTLSDSVRSILVNLHTTQEGRVILAGMQTARFLSASDVDYDVVRTYVAAFERDVRPVEKR